MPNLITTTAATVAERLAELPTDKVAELDAEMAVGFDEHFAFQNAQARAHAAGLLSTDEALSIYAALGELGSADNGGWSAGTSTAVKVAVTLVMPHLITGKRPA